MRAGGLRSRVTIRVFTTDRDSTGQVIQVWEDGETIWAEVKGSVAVNWWRLVLRLPKQRSASGCDSAAILLPPTA